jgi:hypothetical protein
LLLKQEHMRILLFLLLIPGFTMAQVTNIPGITSNASGIGTLAWDNPGYAVAGDGFYAEKTTIGTTEYLEARNFGYNLLNTDIVTGIQVRVQKLGEPNNVSLLDAWSAGTNRVISAGTSRCFVVIIGLENANGPRNVSTVTYGGIPMTQGPEIDVTNADYARIEAWYMLEADIAAAGSTAIAYTLTGAADDENLEIVSSASFEHVDQASPVILPRTGTSTAVSTVSNLSSPFSPAIGSLSIAAIFGGDEASTYAIVGFGSLPGSSLNQQSANPVFPGTGGTLAVANKSNLSTAALNPNFGLPPASVVPLERVMLALTLRRERNMDNSVRLRKASGYTGNNKAVTTDWVSDSPAYTTYGGPGDLWGTTWDYTDINDPGFGAAISAIIQNGAIKVDDIEITVFITSTLPVELAAFAAHQGPGFVECSWITASELNTDKFLIERSEDGAHFETINMLPAAGRSATVRNYTLRDSKPLEGLNYYRLTTVDTDGKTSRSDVIAVEFDRSGKVQIFPNPAADYATIMTNNGFDEIIITDAKGTIIDRFEGTSLQTSHELNIEKMPDGAYFVWVKSHNGNIQAEKLVKASRGM